MFQYRLMVRVYFYDHKTVRLLSNIVTYLLKFASLAIKDLSYYLSLYYVLVCKSNLDLSVFLVTPIFNISRVKMCLGTHLFSRYIWKVGGYYFFFLHVSVNLLFFPKLYLLSFSSLKECSFRFFYDIRNSSVWLQPFLLGNTLLTFVLVRSKNRYRRYTSNNRGHIEWRIQRWQSYNWVIWYRWR